MYVGYFCLCFMLAKTKDFYSFSAVSFVNTSYGIQFFKLVFFLEIALPGSKKSKNLTSKMYVLV